MREEAIANRLIEMAGSLPVRPWTPSQLGPSVSVVQALHVAAVAGAANRSLP